MVKDLKNNISSMMKKPQNIISTPILSIFQSIAWKLSIQRARQRQKECPWVLRILIELEISNNYKQTVNGQPFFFWFNIEACEYGTLLFFG